MRFDDDGNEILSASARLDEADHLARKELERVATDLAALEPPRRAPAPRSQYVKRIHLERRIEQTIELIAGEVGKLFHAAEDRLKALEAREWLGVWEPGKAYAKGALVSHDGSAWVATRDYPDRKPGSGADSGWRLVVKRGHDAR
jgi:hypothetical protein